MAQVRNEELAWYIKAGIPILHRYVASSGTLIFSTAAQFAWFIILARALGSGQFGKLLVIVAVTSLAMTLTGVGAGDAMIRRTARNRHDYQLMLGHGLILIAVTGVVLTAIATGVLCFLVHASASPWENALIMTAFGASNIILFPFITYTEQVFIGLMKFRLANTVNAGFSLVRVLSAALACLVFHVGDLGEWAVWLLGAHIFGALACMAMLRPLGKPVWQVDHRELGLGFHFTTPNLVDALRQNADRLVLGVVAAPSVLGSYGTASRMAQTSQIVVHALNRIVYPKFAQKAHLGIRGVVPLAVRYLLAVLALATFTAIGIYLIAPWMPVLLGPSYDGVIFDLQVLCWLLIPVAAQTVPYDVFGALDRHSRRAVVYNAIGLIGACVTAALVYVYGLSGAFVAAYAVQLAITASLWVTLFMSMERAQAKEDASGNA